MRAKPASSGAPNTWHPDTNAAEGGGHVSASGFTPVRPRTFNVLRQDKVQVTPIRECVFRFYLFETIVLSPSPTRSQKYTLANRFETFHMRPIGVYQLLPPKASATRLPNDLIILADLLPNHCPACKLQSWAKASFQAEYKWIAWKPWAVLLSGDSQQPW